MTEAHQPNREQSELWNQAAGSAWVQMQSVLDEMMAPFNGPLLDNALHGNPRRLLDIGCGAGSTTLTAAKRMGPGSACVGADISGALIELARKRASEEALGNVEFIQADAQTHSFEPNSYDAVISRFGVMFFDDPVAAFTNIRRAARPGGALAFVAWRSPAENPFMTTAARAAAPFLPSLKVPAPGAPGQFGFADAGRVRGILEASGWTNIDISPLDVAAQVAKQDLLAYVTRMGPVGLALQEVHDEPTRARIVSAVQAAFDPFIRDDTAHFNPACWLVSARG